MCCFIEYGKDYCIDTKGFERQSCSLPVVIIVEASITVINIDERMVGHARYYLGA